ncbi:MAG: transcriptional regulator [Pseudomonadota bacterium]
MHPSYENADAHPHVAGDNEAKARRKLLDQKRMEYRRAIEDFAEQRRLQLELADFPELLAATYVSASRAPRGPRPGR